MQPDACIATANAPMQAQAGIYIQCGKIMFMQICALARAGSKLHLICAILGSKKARTTAELHKAIAARMELRVQRQA